MKKVILGSMMFLTGVISIALILSGSMANEWTVNGKIFFFLEYLTIWSYACNLYFYWYGFLGKRLVNKLAG